ncbi:hypothetical protein ACP4OV_005351 [Aristida adscensionis]
MDHDGALRRWDELPGDVLGEIAGRYLHNAADFVRFHAVCRPWREAPPPRAPSFLPWLVARRSPPSEANAGLRVRSPFSGKTLFLPRLRQALAAGTLLKNSDAASGRVLALHEDEDRTTPALVDPLTGDATPLPPLPPSVNRRDARLGMNGVACGNGAVVFYARPWSGTGPRSPPATLLRWRPGEADWEEVDATCPPVNMDYRYASSWDARVYQPAALCWSGVLRGGACAMANKLPREPGIGPRYVLESQGELLCVDLYVVHRMPRRHAPAAASLPAFVSIHALEARGGGRPPEWVAKREPGREAPAAATCACSSTSQRSPASPWTPASSPGRMR